MDILNFISWIKGKRQVTSVDPTKTLIPVGLKDPKRDDDYIAGAISVEDLAAQIAPQTYKVYTALLNQSGNSDPIVTVIENTLGEDLIFIRVGTGLYRANLAQDPSDDRVFISATPGALLPVGVTIFSNYGGGTLTISTYANYSGAFIGSTGQKDSLLANTYLEIRVYN